MGAKDLTWHGGVVVITIRGLHVVARFRQTVKGCAQYLSAASRYAHAGCVEPIISA